MAPPPQAGRSICHPGARSPPVPPQHGPCVSDYAAPRRGAGCHPPTVLYPPPNPTAAINRSLLGLFSPQNCSVVPRGGTWPCSTPRNQVAPGGWSLFLVLPEGYGWGGGTPQHPLTHQ